MIAKLKKTLKNLKKNNSLLNFSFFTHQTVILTKAHLPISNIISHFFIKLSGMISYFLASKFSLTINWLVKIGKDVDCSIICWNRPFIVIGKVLKYFT